MTKIEALKASKKMWDWLAETGARIKQMYFDEGNVPEYLRPTNECYLCEYVRRNTGGFDLVMDCTKCPLYWSDKQSYYYPEGYYTFCEEEDSFYYQWRWARTMEDKKRCAKEIADMIGRALEIEEESGNEVED